MNAPQSTPHGSASVAAVIADAALVAALFGALPAAITDKILAGVIFLVPVSLILGALIGAALLLVSSRRNTGISLLPAMIIPALTLALIGLGLSVGLSSSRHAAVGSPLRGATIPLALYGCFVGIGGGLGAATTINREHL